MKPIRDLDRDIYIKEYPNFILATFNSPANEDEFFVALMDRDGNSFTITERANLEFVEKIFNNKSEIL